jgi:hypothetical protein
MIKNKDKIKINLILNDKIKKKISYKKLNIKIFKIKKLNETCMTKYLKTLRLKKNQTHRLSSSPPV